MAATATATYCIPRLSLASHSGRCPAAASMLQAADVSDPGTGPRAKGPRCEAVACPALECDVGHTLTARSPHPHTRLPSRGWRVACRSSRRRRSARPARLKLQSFAPGQFPPTEGPRRATYCRESARTTPQSCPGVHGDGAHTPGRWASVVARGGGGCRVESSHKAPDYRADGAPATPVSRHVVWKRTRVLPTGTYVLDRLTRRRPFLDQEIAVEAGRARLARH